MVFRLAYGGVTHVSHWSPDQVYDLTAWHLPPQVLPRPTGRVDIRLGLSVLRIDGVPPGHPIEAQIRLADPGPEDDAEAEDAPVAAEEEAGDMD